MNKNRTKVSLADIASDTPTRKTKQALSRALRSAHKDQSKIKNKAILIKIANMIKLAK